MIHGPIILNQRQKVVHRKAQSSICLGGKNFGKSPTAGKVKITIFLDCKGVIIMTVLSRGQTLISDPRFRPLKEIGKHFIRIWFHKTFLCSPVPPDCFAVHTDSPSVVTGALSQGLKTAGTWRWTLHPEPKMRLGGTAHSLKECAQEPLYFTLLLFTKSKTLNNCATFFFVIKPTRCTNFTNLFWHETTCFGQFLCPSSGVYSLYIRHWYMSYNLRAGPSMVLLESCLQTCMTYTSASAHHQEFIHCTFGTSICHTGL